MRQALKLHPDYRCSAVTSLEVAIARTHSGHLALHYFVTGKIGDLRLAPEGAPARGDELWQHTCFEAFVCAYPGAGYCEFNFAPSMQWAAYQFDGYRSGMSVIDEISAPRLEVQSNAESYQLQASLDLNRVPDLPGGGRWHLGVSAVIEETSGRQSYWALDHPAGKADFHRSDCFTYELDPTE